MNHTMTLAHTEARFGGLGVWHRIGEALSQWRQRMRERDELSRFTERELHDAGVTTSDAWVEMNKPFWRA